MKSQVRCILFALIALPAACGGDHAVKPTAEPSSGQVAIAAPPPVVADVPRIEEPSVAVAPAAAPTTFDAAMTEGKALAAKGDHARARELFEAAAKLDRKSAEPHIELARLFVTTGDRALAIAAGQKAVKLAPESSQAYNTLGRAELARFDYDGAIAAFRQATELNGDNVWAWNNLGFTYLQRKQYADAADALAVAVTKPGAEGYMFNNLGTAYEHLDQLDEARDAFEAGGKRGSREAVASRKRLQGVTSIAMVQAAKPVVPTAPVPSYDTREDMPTPEELKADEPADVQPDEPKPEDAPTVDAPAAEAPAAPQVL